MSLSTIFAWGPDFQGSTRPVGLVRIGLALVIWTRFARDMALHSNTEAWHTFFSAFFLVFTVLMLVGLYTRVAVPVVAVLLAMLYFGFGGLGERPHYYAHHVYLLFAATTLLAMTPCGRSYSIDRFRAVRWAGIAGRPPPPERGPLWGQRLIVLQMASLYFWTAVDKTGMHFLSGDRLEAILTWAHSGRPVEPFLLAPAFIVTASIAVVVVEYFLAFGILIRRLHPIAVPLGIALHAAFFVILPLMTYSISMILLYLLVVDPDRVHEVIDRIQGHDQTSRHL